MSTLSRPLTYPATFPLDKGLVAWYPFDDRSGAVLRDRSGKKNHGTISGATWVAGSRGSALSFNGTTNYVLIGDKASLNAVNSISAVAWININTATKWHFIIHKFSRTAGESGWAFLITQTTNRVRLALLKAGVETPLSGNTALALGTLYHVAGVWDGVNMRVYVNGVLDCTPLAYAAADLTNGKNAEVGRESTYYTSGVFDEVRVYNRALNAAEAKRHAESELMLVRH